MKKIIVASIILILLTSTSVLSENNEPINSQEVLPSTNQGYQQGEIIISFKDDVNVAELTTYNGYKIVDKINELNIALIEVDNGEENNIINNLQEQNEISFVDYNFVNTLNSDSEVTFSNSCWTLLKDAVQSSSYQQYGYEDTEHRFCWIASIVGDVHDTSQIEIFGMNLFGLEGRAEDVRVKPLIGNAFFIGDDYEGPNYFRTPLFIGSFDDSQVNGIALFLWIGDWYYKPTCYAELVDWYKALETIYPDFIEVFKANELYNTGTVPNTRNDNDTSDDYDLYYVRITNESLGLHKPEVLFLGSPHGDETVGTIGMYWFTDWLMRMAFTNAPCSRCSKEWLRWLVDNREIYLEVSHNPYGFDNNERLDANLIDLNRDCDYDGYENRIWESVNGKTLCAFVNNHTIRVGCDFHGGVRQLLYPWSSTHNNIMGTSPLSGCNYNYSPPDFYFFDASSLRLGNYIGDYGGNFDENVIGPGADILYEAKGAIDSWAYGADVASNPAEDQFVQDEIWGNYPGAGILWVLPEMSFHIYDPDQTTFGNDIINRYGAEVRRFILHQTDLAQPYIRWQPGTTKGTIPVGTPLTFKWQVNGSLVVDHTYIQWGTNPNQISNYNHTTSDYDGHAGDYYGGTGWDNANNGRTRGITYTETITINKPGEYYFVAKAQVDQIYMNILHPEVYGDNSYLRLIKERTNSSYHEVLEGTDGTEEIIGQTWWYSPIIHITVTDGNSQSGQQSTPSSNQQTIQLSSHQFKLQFSQILQTMIKTTTR